ncbi:hypothetical protein ACO0K9_03755 [Undibacterium sp. Ji50W]|uniref:hypothetical protein n=1 Tax=Undibacterium sp. Ji50W TaxID=3413041 RepID=UPI003BF2799E
MKNPNFSNKKLSTGDGENHEFSHINLVQFFSPAMGIVVNVPDNWVEESSDSIFQVSDPVTGTQFTASAFQNPGLSFDKWTFMRLSMVEEGMPYLREVRGPYPFKAKTWANFAAEYEGRFPEKNEDSRYVVLCMHTDKMLISFTVVANAKVYAANEALYTWLLQNHLEIYDVIRVKQEG